MNASSWLWSSFAALSEVWFYSRRSSFSSVACYEKEPPMNDATDRRTGIVHRENTRKNRHEWTPTTPRSPCPSIRPIWSIRMSNIWISCFRAIQHWLPSLGIIPKRRPPLNISRILFIRPRRPCRHRSLTSPWLYALISTIDNSRLITCRPDSFPNWMMSSAPNGTVPRVTRWDTRRAIAQRRHPVRPPHWPPSIRVCLERSSIPIHPGETIRRFCTDWNFSSLLITTDPIWERKEKPVFIGPPRRPNRYVFLSLSWIKFDE